MANWTDDWFWRGRGGSRLQYSENLTPEERERGLDECLAMFSMRLAPYVPPPEKVKPPTDEERFEMFIKKLEANPRYRERLREVLEVY